MLWVGIDVGGTFTDIVVYDDKSGTVSAGKSPSTPSEPSEGVVNALKQLSVDLVKVFNISTRGHSRYQYCPRAERRRARGHYHSGISRCTDYRSRQSHAVI